MTRGRAVKILLTEWLFCAAIISAIVTVQSILGKFGDDSEAAWAWVAGIFVPPLSLLVTAALAESSIHWHDGPADGFKFWLAFVVCTICGVVVLAMIFVEPLINLSYFQLFEKAALALAVWQGIAIAAIAAVVFEGR